MNTRAVFHLVSYLVMVVSLAMAASAAVSLGMGDGSWVASQLLRSAGMSLLLGGLLNRLTRGPVNLSRKDGFAIVTFGWLTVGLVGALPYLMTGAIPHPVDAVFETISGFTTTGSTILNDIEVLPRGVIFWRSLTQWLGGMGVLLLCVAILPFLGVGGMQIYRAEMPGPSKERLTPRIGDTAKLLYGVYLLLTVAEIVCLTLAGMTLYDAVNHTFCTLSGGGFSPYNASIAHYTSSTIHWIIIVFMLLGGINFALHFRVLRGDWRAYSRSEELKAYLMVVVVAVGLIFWNLWSHGLGESAALRLRDASFQVATLISTTGFATADYDQWPLFTKTIMFLLLFSGGCAGSTSGAIKIMRTQVVVKEVSRQLFLFMQPQRVMKVKLQGQTVDRPVVASIMAFFTCYFGVFVLATLCLSLMTPNLVTAASAVAACLGNVGPGFDAVGPVQNFTSIPYAGKGVLMMCMLLGRLELFTVLVLFAPSFWKK